MGDDTGDTQPGTESRPDFAKANYHRDLIELLRQLDAQIVELRQQLVLAKKLPSDPVRVAELRTKISELESNRNAYDELLTREGAFPAAQEGGLK